MTTETKASTMKPPSKQWRFIALVVLFMLFGPLVGAVGVNAFLTLLAVIGELTRGEFGDLPRLIVGGMVVGTIYSVIIAYTIGLPSALGVGLIVAWKSRRSGEVSLRTALVASLGFWAGCALVALLIVLPDGRMDWIGAILVAHLSAAFACGWLAKKFFSFKHSDQD